MNLIFHVKFGLLFVAFNAVLFSSQSGFSLSSSAPLNFRQAKKIIAKIQSEHPETIYCPCKYSGKNVDLESCGYKIHKDEKRAQRIEWEHIVPAENFGKSFIEWRVGLAQCISKNGKRFKGRKCAETNADFNKMESDLYNLWPIIGELNGLRSNYSMAAISGESEINFGKCGAKIQAQKFEPMDQSKGIVARTYMYMDETYPSHGIISDKNKKLFDAWDKLYPAGEWECKRGRRIQEIQGNTNFILKSRCH